MSQQAKFLSSPGIGSWRDNVAFLSLHTQDPGAAMDDRFDMQIASTKFFDGNGFEYLSAATRSSATTALTTWTA